MKSVAGAQISPDGRYVAYTVQQANWEENDFVTQIWVAVTATGERYQLTSGKKSSTGPQWSPDSRRLAFTSDRDGKRQIYLISPSRRRGHARSPPKRAASRAIAWSPDGASIAFTSSGPDAKPRKDRKEKYGEFEIIEQRLHHEPPLARQAPADWTTKPKATPSPAAIQFSVGAFSWSPDGKRIAFAAAPRSRPRLAATPSPSTCSTSPTCTSRSCSIPPAPQQSQVVAQRPRDRLHHLQRRAEFLLRQPLHRRRSPPKADSPACSPRISTKTPTCSTGDRDGIYFGATQKTAAHTFRVDPATRAIRRITGPDAFHATGAILHQGSPHLRRRRRLTQSLPRNLRLLRLRFRSADTSPTSPRSTRISASPPAKWSQWKSKDGAAIEGILIKPADFDPTRKYPLLVVIHGGPTGVDTPLHGRRPQLPDRALRRQRARSSSSPTTAARPATAKNSARSTSAISAWAITTT